MASENVNVRITGNLRNHLNQQIGANGLYENASEYIRDLIRRDLQNKKEANSALTALRAALIEGEESGDAGKLDMEEIKRAAKKEAGLI